MQTKKKNKQQRHSVLWTTAHRDRGVPKCELGDCSIELNNISLSVNTVRHTAETLGEKEGKTEKKWSLVSRESERTSRGENREIYIRNINVKRGCIEPLNVDDEGNVASGFFKIKVK